MYIRRVREGYCKVMAAVILLKVVNDFLVQQNRRVYPPTIRFTTFVLILAKNEKFCTQT